MKIIIMDCQALRGLTELIVEDLSIAGTDEPVVDNNGLIIDQTVKNIINKTMYIFSRRDDEVTDDDDVRDRYIEHLTNAKSLDWIVSLDWYEIDYNISSETLYVKVKE